VKGRLWLGNQWGCGCYQREGEVGLALCPQLPAGYVLSGRSRGGVGSAGQGLIECEADVGLSARSRLFRERDECMVIRTQNITG